MAGPGGIDFYAELKGWQTAIGSILGFFALVIGALFNFRLNRRRDALLRNEESVAAAVALYGEILLLRKELARLAREVAAIYIREGTSRVTKTGFDAHLLQRHPISEPLLYKALASKIGLLDASLVRSITAFHNNCRETISRLPLLMEDSTRDYTYGAEYVLIPACAAVHEVMPALRKIEQLAGIQEKAEPIDTGRAEDVIDMQDHE
ncbi:MAG: hypothetical protein KDJ25_11150 [Rhodoblastus sp.]|nr:hypothetical protein [Rhodoblastus sp.]